MCGVCVCVCVSVCVFECTCMKTVTDCGLIALINADCTRFELQRGASVTEVHCHATYMFRSRHM